MVRAHHRLGEVTPFYVTILSDRIETVSKAFVIHAVRILVERKQPPQIIKRTLNQIERMCGLES